MDSLRNARSRRAAHRSRGPKSPHPQKGRSLLRRVLGGNDVPLERTGRVACGHVAAPLAALRRVARTGVSTVPRLRWTYRTLVAPAPVMFRFTLAGLFLIAPLVGCATPTVGPVRSANFTNDEQKLLACLDLQDHIVDLYATEYVTNEGINLSSTERVAFRDGWAEELAKRGTFDRFEQSCFYSLTPNKYHCGMQSQSTGGLEACMKLSMR